MSQPPVIGVDLGTSFSVMAHLHEDGQPRVIPNAEGERLTPSVVYFDGSQFIVGRSAKRAAASHPQRAVQFVKRHMGKPDWRVKLCDREFSAPEISSQILRKLKNDAESALGVPIEQAVITVPYHFKDVQRRATKEAAELAGLEVVKLLNEPTAAAIAFGVDRVAQREVILVYDLGGGTLDVTLCRVDGLEVVVLGVDGNPSLGGKDFDDSLLKFVADQFQQAHGIDPRADPYAAEDLRDRVVQAKHDLTDLRETSLTVMADSHSHRISVSRDQFEDLNRMPLALSQVHMSRAISASKLGYEDIDRILLVGGSTRMPMVRQMLEGQFGREIRHSTNPDEVVALGAAIEAARLRADRTDGDDGVSEVTPNRLAYLQVLDVVPHSIGILTTERSTNRPTNSVLIRKNSRVPCQVKQEFRIDREGAEQVRVVVFQGESENPADVQRVGDFILSGLPPGRPRGMPVEVSIVVNENGIVEVHAHDKHSGRALKETILR